MEVKPFRAYSTKLKHLHLYNCLLNILGYISYGLGGVIPKSLDVYQSKHSRYLSSRLCSRVKFILPGLVIACWTVSSHNIKVTLKGSYKLIIKGGNCITIHGLNLPTISYYL